MYILSFLTNMAIVLFSLAGLAILFTIYLIWLAPKYGKTRFSKRNKNSQNKINDFAKIGKKFLDDSFKPKKSRNLVSLGPKHEETIDSLCRYLNDINAGKNDLKNAVHEFFLQAKIKEWENISTSVPEEDKLAVRGFTPGAKPKLFLIVKDGNWIVSKK